MFGSGLKDRPQVASPHRRRTYIRVSILLLLAFGLLLTSAVMPALAAEPILTENFDSVSDGSLPNGFQAVEGKWEVRQGRLVGKSPSSAVQGRIVFGDPTWTNYEMEATMTYLSVVEPSRWAALLYRVRSGGAPPYYLFTIRNNAAASNGLELASRTPSGQWAVYLTKAWKAAMRVGEPHRLRIVVFGTSVRYYVDGELVIRMDNIVTEPAGMLGFHVNGSEVAFDDLVVRKLSQEDVSDVPTSVQGLIPPVPATDLHKPPMIIAHRGASGVAPENTLAAFRKATEIGVDLLELDVHRTKDGELVVIHDGTVNRTAKGKVGGAIAALTLAQIQSLDAGAWKGAEYAGERVPTLQETLEASRGKAIFLIEGKVRGIEAQIAEVIQKTGMVNNVIYQSFDKESVRQFRQVLPQVPAGVLFGDPGISDQSVRGAMLVTQVVEVNASIVAVSFYAISPEFVKYAHARGVTVFAWTVDDVATMQRMIDAGVDGILTNYPERLKAFLEEWR